uniref:type II secretion system protein N n=1 Tax=Burkholderia anthina TaxID=179879 RepID=UPI00158C82B9|nr:type II secretion system protein N [Burkholderia anthina]
MKPADLLRSFPPPSAAAPAVATFAAGLAFAGVVAWAVHVLRTPDLPVPARAVPPPFDVSAGARLFGTPPGDDAQHAIQLLGILSFDARRAAAIVSIGGDPARVVRLGSTVGNAGTLAEVRARSIVVDRDGLQREIALPAAQNPGAFVR